MHVSNEDFALFSLAQLLLRRPRIFTASGNLAEVIAFMRGYAFGIENRQVADKSVMDFWHWVSTETGESNAMLLPTHRLIRKLVKRHHSERRVLKVAATYLKERRSEA